MKPKTKPMKQGLTTGEASKILGISRSGVVRLFERRILTGRKNPITRWRVIDRESVETLKRKRGWKWKRTVVPAKQKEG